MTTRTLTRTRSNSRPLGRLFVLLVLAVLSGVLGMHGLAPGAAVTAAPTGAGRPMVMPDADGVPHADGGCRHTDGGSGHLDHADAACAAGGISSSYTPPAPAAGPVLHAPAATDPASSPTGSPHDGRAPPDLSELQLLRI
ncbi:DUF6153 family protein [Streptomyces longwoodensis]|uniref:DUF6153 family protein n=1 Tax=Streptomyces longwoodensis TaxID=68231 RepID=UPI00324751A4